MFPSTIGRPSLIQSMLHTLSQVAFTWLVQVVSLSGCSSMSQTIVILHSPPPLMLLWQRCWKIGFQFHRCNFRLRQSKWFRLKKKIIDRLWLRCVLVPEQDAARALINWPSKQVISYNNDLSGSALSARMRGCSSTRTFQQKSLGLLHWQPDIPGTKLESSDRSWTS